MSRALERLIEEWSPERDEEDFKLKLRVYSRWDERQFRRLLELSEAALEELENEPVTDPARWMLDRNIRMSVELMNHPGFRAEPPGGLSESQYADYLDERAKLFEDVRERFLRLAARK